MNIRGVRLTIAVSSRTERIFGIYDIIPNYPFWVGQMASGFSESLIGNMFDITNVVLLISFPVLNDK